MKRAKSCIVGLLHCFIVVHQTGSPGIFFFTKVWYTTSFWHRFSLVILYVDFKTGGKKPTETDSLDERMHFVWFSEQLPHIGLWQKSRTEHLSESDYSLILFYCFCLFFG